MQIGTKQRAAALMVAEDAQTDVQIGAQVGIDARTLFRWKSDPEFAALVDAHIAEFAQVVRRSGIGRVDNRVRRLDRDWRRMREVIECRARDAAGASNAQRALMEATLKQGGSQAQALQFAGEIGGLAPGMETGLLVRTVKFNKQGDEIEEFAVDTGLLAEIRAHEQQAAKELGQWVEKQQSDLGGDSLTLLRKVLIGDTEKPGTGAAALGMGTP